MARLKGFYAQDAWREQFLVLSVYQWRRRNLVCFGSVSRALRSKDGLLILMLLQTPDRRVVASALARHQPLPASFLSRLILIPRPRLLPSLSPTTFSPDV